MKKKQNIGVAVDVVNCVDEKKESPKIEELMDEVEYWKDKYYQKKKVFDYIRYNIQYERDTNEDLEKEINQTSWG